MGILSSATLIRTISLVHLTISYYLLTQPSLIASHNAVLVFSRSMQLPDATSNSSSLSAPSPAAALAALFLGLLGMSDFIAAGLGDLAYHEHWGAQAPIRISLLLLLNGWIYITKPDDQWGFRAGRKPTEELKNGLVFGWAFVEMLSFFWVFLKLRDERQELARALQEKEERERR